MFKPNDTETSESRIQDVYRFPNGYGASVVGKLVETYSVNRRRTEYTWEWELAVILFDGEGIGEFNVVTDTPVTHDVIRTDNRNGAFVQELLLEISELPPR